MAKKTCPNCGGQRGWWVVKGKNREWVECDWCDGTGKLEEASK